MSWFDFLIIGFLLITVTCMVGRPLNSFISLTHLLMLFIASGLVVLALYQGIATDSRTASILPIGPRHDKAWPDTNFLVDRLPPTNPVKRTPTNKYFKQALKSAFKVEVRKCGRSGYGSGWVWKKGEAVTNAHVAAAATSIVLHREDGSKAFSRLLRVDRKRDIAIISVPEDWYPIPILPTNGYGWSVGYPGGGSRNIIPNNLRQIYGEFRGPGNTFSSWQKLIQGSSTIYQGMSGGPVLDQKGNAVGVNAMFLEGGTPNMLAIPATEIKAVQGNSGWSKNRCSFG